MRSARARSTSPPASSWELLLGVGAGAFLQPLRDAARDLLRGEIVGVGERLLGRAGAEAIDADDEAVADDAVPVVAARRLDGHQPCLAVGDEPALLLARPLEEALDAGHRDDANFVLALHQRQRGLGQ